MRAPRRVGSATRCHLDETNMDKTTVHHANMPPKFAQVLDGSPEAGERSRRMLGWDVSNGVARWKIKKINF